MKRMTLTQREQRLDQMEALLLEGYTRTQLLDHFQGKGPLAGCNQSPCQQAPHSCFHGPVRWQMEPGKPVSERTLDAYVAKARTRLFQRSQEERRKNRAWILGQIDRAISHCWKTKEMKELISLLRFRSELDGSRLASDELQAPTLYQSEVPPKQWTG